MSPFLNYVSATIDVTAKVVSLLFRSQLKPESQTSTLFLVTAQTMSMAPSCSSSSTDPGKAFSGGTGPDITMASGASVGHSEQCGNVDTFVEPFWMVGLPNIQVTKACSLSLHFPFTTWPHARKG